MRCKVEKNQQQHITATVDPAHKFSFAIFPVCYTRDPMKLSSQESYSNHAAHIYNRTPMPSQIQPALIISCVLRRRRRPRRLYVYVCTQVLIRLHEEFYFPVVVSCAQRKHLHLFQ